MADLAALGLRFDTPGADAAISKLDQVAEKSGKAERATDALSTARTRAGGATAQMIASIEREIRELVALTRAQSEAAASAAAMAKRYDDAAAAAGRAANAQRGVRTTFTQGAAGAKLYGHEMLNLSRQFADIGVTAAMGMNPLTILIQQGPQIGETFAMASARGITFSGVLKQVAAAAWAALAPLAPFIAVALGLAAVIGGTLALATRQLNKDNGDLTKGMGLTEAQLERVKDKGITMGDVLRGTFSWLGKQAAPLLKPIADWFSKLFDDITKGTVMTAKALVGGFLGAFEAIKATWRMLPAALGDATISATNLVLGAIEKLINLAAEKLNQLLVMANSAAKAAGLAVQVPMLPQVSVTRVANPFSGAGEGALAAGGAAFGRGFARGGEMVDNALSGIGDSILDAARKRITKEAGKAGRTAKTPADPRDQTEERTAQIAAALAQARADELQAQLVLTKDIRARATLEKAILAQETAAKQAQVSRTIASIQDDKGLSDAKKRELVGQLILVKGINAKVETLKIQAIDEAAAQALAKESLDLQTAALGDQIDILHSQADVADFAYQRREIDLKILKLQQQAEKLKLREITVANGATATEEAIAKARLAVLDQIHANQKEALTGGIEGAFNNVSDALNDMARAFKSRNWNALVNGLIEAIGSIKQAFGPGGTMADKIGTAAGIAGAAGNALGGVAGAGLAGAAGGAMAGASLVTAGLVSGPVGWVALAGAALGTALGIFGASSAKKKAKQAEEDRRAQEEADRLARVAAEARSQEIMILELSGKSLEAVALSRKYELEAMDPANRARQEEIYALRDLAAAQAAAADASARATEVARQRRGIEIQIMEAANDNLGALNAKRAIEREELEASLRPLQDLAWALTDANGALAAANDNVAAQRDTAIAAYNREADAIRATRDRMQGFVETLSSLKAGLISGPEAMLNPFAQYRASRNAFDRLNALPAGDETRMAQMPAAVQALLQASRAIAPTSAFYNRDLAATRAAVVASLAAAKDQVDIAQAQLDALNGVVGQLGLLNGNVVSFAASIQGYTAALAAQSRAQVVQAGAAGAATNDFGTYLSHNPDIAEAASSDFGKSFGSAEKYAAWHFEQFGKAEIAAGLRGFASGTNFAPGGPAWVGEEGPEIVDLPRGARVIPNDALGSLGADPELAEAVDTLARAVAALAADTARTARNTDKLATRWDRLERGGLYVRGSAPDDPVSTQAAA